MNLLRSLTKEQLYHLERICEGDVVLLWDPEDRCYRERGGAGFAMPNNHPWPGKRWRRCSKRPWLGSCVVDLLQRKVLADEGGRLMPSKAAAKLFGRPPRIEPPKKPLKMSRTRAARDQDAPPKRRKAKKPTDRTGQVWECLGEPRLILGPPDVEELSLGRYFAHPTLGLHDASQGNLAEREGDPFEGKPGHKRLA